MHYGRLPPSLEESNASQTMGPDQRLVRVDVLRIEVRQGLVALNAETHGSERWEACLAQLELHWRDLFALLDELEPG